MQTRLLPIAAALAMAAAILAYAAAPPVCSSELDAFNKTLQQQPSRASAVQDQVKQATDLCNQGKDKDAQKILADARMQLGAGQPVASPHQQELLAKPMDKPNPAGNTAGVQPSDQQQQNDHSNP